MLNALATLATRHSRRVIAIAALVALAAAVLASGVADRLDPYGAEDPDTESVAANELLQAAGHQDLAVVLLVSGRRIDDPKLKRRVTRLAAQLERDPAVGDVIHFFNTGLRRFVSRDERSTYLAVRLKARDDRGQQDVAERLEAKFGDLDDVGLGGPAIVMAQLNTQVEKDLRRAEMIAFPILFVLTLLFFRSLVAAFLPLLLGGLAIVGTLMLLWVASHVTSISIFSLNLITGLGIGLAIDYSLFIVSRYREEIARTGPGIEAMRRTMETAGRTVLFSSLTVAGALASLLVFPQRFLYSMGLGGALVALMAALLALVVLPAILALLGERVNALSPSFLQRRAEQDARPTSSGGWYRLSRGVMRRPGAIAAAATTLLVVVSLPFLEIEFTSQDAQVLPTSTSARQVDDTFRAEFAPYRDTPIQLAVDGASRTQIGQIERRVGRLDAVAAVDRPQQLRGDVVSLDVISRHGPTTNATRDLVAQVRDLPGGGPEPLVTGYTAELIDHEASLVDHLPLVLAIIAAVTFIVLFLMTGSVVLPIKALLMNVLTVGATLGILVLIFQDGRFEGLLGYTSQGALDATEPILLFAVVFGLSTDYGVFMLSRIKEARDAGASDSDAVAIGLERTGRIVTSAALLFCVAIGAFATSEVVFIKQLGLGTAVAVLIDATIVRALLVPSLMELLGRYNWWAPRPLRRLHDRIGLSEA